MAQMSCNDFKFPYNEGIRFGRAGFGAVGAGGRGTAVPDRGQKKTRAKDQPGYGDGVLRVLVCDGPK
jgi:hypothetical protein